MSKHDEAREYVDGIDGSGYFQRLHKYITDMETMEKENIELKEENRILKERETIIIKKHEDLKYSVKRWFALLEKDNETAEEVKDFVAIKEKLSKVGDEE